MDPSPTSVTSLVDEIAAAIEALPLPAEAEDYPDWCAEAASVALQLVIRRLDA